MPEHIFGRGAGDDSVAQLLESYISTPFQHHNTGFVQDYDMQIQGVFRNYSRTKTKFFKEL